jgi:putative membrane protein
MKKINLPIFLLSAYAIFFAVLAVSPVDRGTWWVENLTILPIVAILSGLYLGGIRFSNLSYIMMSFLIFMHTFGGHYSFANVPFDWFTDFFGFERNHYDRIAHFTVGFFAFPIVEILLRYQAVNKKWVAYTYGVFAIMALALLYELFEWQFAILADPSAGIAILGSQGDIWDAQKDMLADSLGAIFAVVVFALVRPREKGRL